MRRVDADLVEFDDKATVGEGGLAPLLDPGQRVASHRTVEVGDEGTESVGMEGLPEEVDSCRRLWCLNHSVPATIPTKTLSLRP
jgi:hypothetical protein